LALNFGEWFLREGTSEQATLNLVS
jgi:hypothetical protein